MLPDARIAHLSLEKNKLKKKMLFACCFLAASAGAFRLYYIEYRENAKYEALAEIHDGQEVSGTEDTGAGEASDASAAGLYPSQGFLELSEINEDYLGWLTVYDTQVDLPVVLGEDNEFYLHHDFYGAESSYGTLFADCLTNVEEDGNMLIYGHHMKNGSMFGSLKSFTDEEFFRKNGIVRWESAYDVRYYEIFAVLVVPGDESAEDYLPVRDYLGTMDQERQEKIMEELRNRAILWKDGSVFENNRLLFLMTCDYTRDNGRLLLCGYSRE